jgi:hypothetical protein
MKSWLARFSSAVIITALAAILSFSAYVLVLRLLSVLDAGRYVLLSSLTELISIGGFFGQAAFLNRTYSRSNTPHRWQQDLLGTFLFCSPLLIGSILLTLFLYRLDPFETFFVISTVLLDGLALLCAWMLNSQRHYSWSALLLRLANILLIVPIVVMILAWHSAPLHQVLTAQILIDLLCAVAGMILVARLMPSGTKTLNFRERWQSSIFGLMVLSNLTYDPGLAAVGGYFIAGAPLAALGAYLSLARPFNILQGLFVQTLSVELVRDPGFPRRATNLLVGLGALILTVGAALALPLISHALFTGRYDDFGGLALPFALAGGLMLTECLPRSAILGLSDTVTLNRFAFAQVVIALCVIASEIGLVIHLGVVGIGWAAMVMFLLRNLVSYGVYFSNALYSSSTSSAHRRQE